jgi:hypothetical protein
MHDCYGPASSTHRGRRAPLPYLFDALRRSAQHIACQRDSRVASPPGEGSSLGIRRHVTDPPKGGDHGKTGPKSAGRSTRTFDRFCAPLLDRVMGMRTFRDRATVDWLLTRAE